MLEAAQWAGMTRADMKILHGIVGEGMGHATRSKVILDELKNCPDIISLPQMRLATHPFAP
jgi:hypothetical protein